MITNISDLRDKRIYFSVLLVMFNKYCNQLFILSEELSISEMATSLTSLLKPEKRKLVGENGRRIALRYSWEKTADRVADLYRTFGNSNDYWL